MQHCALAAAFFTVVLLPSAAMAEVRAGAAKRVITPDLKLHGPVYMAGFDHNRKATGIHDDLLCTLRRLLNRLSPAGALRSGSHRPLP